MRWPHSRDVIAVTLIALVSGALCISPALDRVRGLSLDALTALRWHVFGNRADPAAPSAVVVAIDEETYRTPPFHGTPGVAWTREIGRVLTAIIEGGAKVVGFDIVYPTSIEQSEIPFGDETLGSAAARLRPRIPARAGGGPPAARSCSARSSTRIGPSCRRPASASQSVTAQHPRAERL